MLTAAERKQLKTRAHALHPMVMIGGKGLTDEVVKEIELALKAHELVKVRAPSLGREQREQVLELVLQRTLAELVQRVGKVFVLYRKRDEAR
jgi:RNA-binding protein